MPRVLVHRADRAVEEAVGLPGGVGDLLRAQRGQLVDLAAEFGGGGVQRDEVGDEGVGARVELARRLVADRHQPAGSRRRDGRDGRGRRQDDRCFGWPLAMVPRAVRTPI